MTTREIGGKLDISAAPGVGIEPNAWTATDLGNIRLEGKADHYAFGLPIL